MGTDLHISIAYLDERKIRIAINTDASLREEIDEILMKKYAMQAIVTPKETVWY